MGPFALDERLGAGGMGEVWCGRHPSGLPVAVKLDLHPPDDARRAAFLHEVRLVAGLDHPHVVQVYDAGVVTAGEAKAGGPLREGAPWLAMELAAAGSLADARPTRWEELRHLLAALLRGLAHAHARGVVHRDLKPANLLLAGPRGARTGGRLPLLEARPVLSDFGIGVHGEVAGHFDDARVGTPRYMAPEQLVGDRRATGPWTDLYQAGVVAWRLATGQFPFPAPDPARLADVLREVPAPFAPAFDVPAGLEPLLRRALARPPGERPRFAADVLRALEGLGAPVPGSGRSPAVAPVSDAPTVLRTGPRDTTRPTAEGGRATAGRVGAGLGLWGLRPIPLVGRAEARRHLVESLEHVALERRPSAVLLRGPEGSGKTRLARWLAEDAHERGLADTWRARHGAEPDPDAGLVGMLRRELRLAGAGEVEATTRLERAGHDAVPLVRWLLRGHTPSLPERFARVAAALAVADRPRIVWIDDAQRGLEALGFVEYALQRLRAPVLFVVPVRDEEVAADPDIAARVAALARSPRVTGLDVPPLDADEHRELVRGLLGLEAGVAAEVEERTAGNPRFAVALVGAWVEAGVLVPGARGLGLRGGAPPELPADLGAVWVARLDRVLVGHPADDAAAVELAALLGPAFERADWARSTARAGLSPAPDLVERLLRAALLRADREGGILRFAHALLREAVLARSRAAGRAPALAGAAAGALAEVAAPGVLGELLIEAGRLDEAVGHLIREADARQTRGDLRPGPLLDRIEETLDRLGADRADPRRGEVAITRAQAWRAQGRKAEAEVLLQRVERDARRYGWSSQLGSALMVLGIADKEAGRFPEALGRLARAEALLLDEGRVENAAACRMYMGDVHEWSGRTDEAERLYRSAIGAFDGPAGWAYAHLPFVSLAQLHHRRGQDDAARAFAARAVALATRSGLQKVLAHMANLEGELARSRGDLDAAAERYQDAVRRYQLFQDDDANFPTLNLGVVQVLLGRHAEARAMLEPLLAVFEARGDRILVAYCASVLLAASAEAELLPAFDRHLATLGEILDRTGLVDPDLARLSALAAQRVPDAGRAARAQAIADAQRARLG